MTENTGSNAVQNTSYPATPAELPELSSPSCEYAYELHDTGESDAVIGEAENENYLDIVMEAATVGDMLSAKSRLAQMYRKGDGVEKDSAESVRWYSLAALQAINKLNSAPSMNRAEAAFSILFDLGELHYEIGDSQRAIGTFLRMSAMLDSLPEELLCPQTDRWMQICSNKLGALYERTAKPNEAYGHFTRALSIAERAAETDSSDIVRDDLAVASYRVGFIDHLFRGERALLDRARTIWEELYNKTGNYEYRRKKCVIDTLFATTAVMPEHESAAENTDSAAAAENITADIQPAADTSAGDALSAELAEYIREHGYSKSSPFAGIRPVVDALIIAVLIAICLLLYFTGAFHEIFRFFRNL